MNKIKLLYDVVRTMKEKQNIQGTFQAEAQRDQVKIFGCNNEFARNTVTGEGRLKVSTAFDWDGQTMKHESCTEFNMKGCCGGEHPCRHAFLSRHFHCHPGMGPGATDGCGPFPGHLRHGMHGGWKGGLTRAAFLLHLLNSITVAENADQSYLLTLKLADLPEDLRRDFQERMNQRRMHSEALQCHFEATGREAPGFLKELHTLDHPALTLILRVNQNYEVETVELELSGQVSGAGVHDENKETHDVDLKARLNLTH